MKKVLLLGVENSHAKTFLRLIKEDPAYSDVAVKGVYSSEAEAANGLAEEFGVPVMETFAGDPLGGDAPDGVIITARHGDNHLKYALPYIKKGARLFIDKPITCTEDDALTLGRLLKENSVLITGGSSCRFDPLVKELKAAAESETYGKTLGGFVRAPFIPDSPYGGFYFYAQHLVEIVSEIFGRYPKAVTAKKNGKLLSVLFHYDGYDVYGEYVSGEKPKYAAYLSAQTGVKGGELAMAPQVFEDEFAAFYRVLNSENSDAAFCNYEDFIAPVFVLNAIDRSEKNGKTEPVHTFRI